MTQTTAEEVDAHDVTPPQGPISPFNPEDTGRYEAARAIALERRADAEADALRLRAWTVLVVCVVGIIVVVGATLAAAIFKVLDPAVAGILGGMGGALTQLLGSLMNSGNGPTSRRHHSDAPPHSR